MVNGLCRVNGNKCFFFVLHRLAVLRKWRSKHGPAATYENLAIRFYQADMLDMAEVVCQALESPRQQGITSKFHWLHIYR